VTPASLWKSCPFSAKTSLEISAQGGRRRRRSGKETQIDEHNGAMSSMQQTGDWTSYDRDLLWLEYAVHELPAGVLWRWGNDGATRGQCAEMLDDLDQFAHVCDRLGLDDHQEFIDGCRWHFEHYPHYIGRLRHFVNYATYVRDRHGPVRVSLPPRPDRLRGGSGQPAR
jgi:hypothetical protein